jgi:hypothetical protein
VLLVIHIQCAMDLINALSHAALVRGSLIAGSLRQHEALRRLVLIDFAPKALAIRSIGRFRQSYVYEPGAWRL